MKKTGAVFFVLFCAVLVFGAVIYFRSNKETQSTVYALDTVIDIRLLGADVKETEQEIVDCINGFENDASMFKDGSDIYRINDSAGKAFVKVSARVFELIKESRKLCEESGGKFDITIGPLVTAWDITGDNPKVPEVTGEMLELINYEDIILNEETSEVMLKKRGQKIDLGGVAKGAVSDDIMRILQGSKVKEAVINLGGNVIVYGNKTFKVGIKHPRKQGELIGVVKASNRIVSTTGDYERYFEIDGKRYHHILDPKTGMPYGGDFYSVTVIGENGLLADFLSTKLFMTPKSEVLECMKDYDVIAVGKDGNVYTSKNLDFETADKDFALIKGE